MTKQSLTRFAPSPTGHLHLGHVLSAFYVWAAAKAQNCKIILRIEDHDRVRCKKNYETSILRDLEWLGFEPDFGPWRQSDHHDRYVDALEKLAHKTYACSCSRKHMALSDSGELYYPGTCRDLALNPQGNSIRFCATDKSEEYIEHFPSKHLAKQNPAKQCGDFVVRERNGNFSYNFCVVVDDLVGGVDWIVRGQDLTHAVGRQLQLRSALSKALQNKSPELNFFHHPLILDEHGQKLSKRFRSTTIKSLREDGISPGDVLSNTLQFVGLDVKANRAKDYLGAVIDKLL